MKNSLGTLYLVGSPIGNLGDFTFRAVETLKSTDFIYCEDTRRSKILFTHYKIEPKKQPTALHEHSSSAILNSVAQKLRAGYSVAYLTDGGMPGISDPGFLLVRLAKSLEAPIEVVPGPSAVTSFFALCQLPSPKFLFHGFFPRTKGEVEKVLETMKTVSVVHLFFESPQRVGNTLDILKRNLPKQEIILARELTKIYQEILSDTVEGLSEKIGKEGKLRGEIVFGVMGGEVRAKMPKSSAQSGIARMAEKEQVADLELTEDQKRQVRELVQSGESSKDAAKILAKKWSISRRVIYEFIIHHLT